MQLSKVIPAVCLEIKLAFTQGRRKLFSIGGGGGAESGEIFKFRVSEINAISWTLGKI
jgi:hypothetical protein